MLSFYDSGALQNALTLPLRPDIKALLQRRITQIYEDGLGDHTHLVVVTADDTETTLVEEIGFSPLVADGHRFGSPGFIPRWDILHDHGGWFELVHCIGNGGFTFVLLIEDRESPNGLAALCRAYLSGDSDTAGLRA